LKENTIQTIQKSNKILQDKFLKLCSDKRKKEQEDLLIQVKEMKIKKNEREKGNLSINRILKIKKIIKKKIKILFLN